MIARRPDSMDFEFFNVVKGIYKVKGFTWDTLNIASQLFDSFLLGLVSPCSSIWSGKPSFSHLLVFEKGKKKEKIGFPLNFKPIEVWECPASVLRS